MMTRRHKEKTHLDVVDHSADVHQALTIVLVLAQCFGQMPVQGITSPSPRSLKFTWVSFRFAYSILEIIGATFVVFALSMSISRNGMNIPDVGVYRFPNVERRDPF